MANTIKEAILIALEKTKKTMTYMDVHEFIISNKLYDFGTAKTPWNTISKELGDFIRKKDTRVKRFKVKNSFHYYLAKYEENITFQNNDSNEEAESSSSINTPNKTDYLERDLHKLFSSFLKSQNIYPKTILHERSGRSEEHQRWIHPDIVGLKLIKLKNNHSNALRKIISKEDAFHLYSYELKKSISSDYELKKYFFQAVSNSSWANYGYLVALEIADNLHDELERLNKAFGIGMISLSANVFESSVLFPARYNKLDFQTIDKLCLSNKDFEAFIEKSEGLLSADKRYFEPTRLTFETFCDECFTENQDEEIKAYCEKLNIPFDSE